MSPIKHLTRIALCSLLLLCLCPVILCQTRRFKGNQEVKPYTHNLPVVDKVELLELKLRGDLWDGESQASKIVEGNEAQKIASLWRTQTYNSYSAICHNPAYAIKFYSQGQLRVFATLCWDCDNIRFITPKLEKTQGFDGGGQKGQHLLQLFRTAFPKR
ncbi:MAG: hypothetical protein ACJ74W_01105 [Pyrinomonadaceae bacterium]